nr:pentatricopeptide repeat-containing protein At1g73710-like isoform X1 [Arachis hypogaea]
MFSIFFVSPLPSSSSSLLGPFANPYYKIALSSHSLSFKDSIFIAKGSEEQEEEGVWRRIRDVGLFPDDVTHRALLGALCSKNMVQAVEILIDEMEKSSVSVDEHSLPSIIEMYVNEGALDKANDMLQKFLMNGVPSSSICAAIMDAFAEKGHWLEAENVFYWERGVPGQRRDAIEYNVLIKAYGWWTKL